MSFKVTVLPGGQAFAVEPGQTVLDAALAAGLILPYSCRTGACSTCRGRVVSGEYAAGEAPAHILEAEDLARGYTLLCQARPSSDLVIEAREVRMAGDIHVRKMPVRVLALQPLADDVMEITLQLPSAEAYRYNPGQYLEFILKDGRRRAYSMAAPSSQDHTVRLHVRHMPGGAFTSQVFGAAEPALKARDILRIEGPLGSFFLREDTDKPVVFLASGTGFAPIKAIVEHMIATGVRRPATLYWGGRRPADLYMDALAREWRERLPGFRYVPVVSEARPADGWTGREGLVHRAVMADLPDLSGHQVYACGAPAMVEAARRDFVQSCGLPGDEFYADAFTSEIDRLEAGV
ncbi:CDP-6-deoxy-delta-3,4-glucoseen reductase [Castellaniella sp. S9]|uniref:CDP-6-deoxy-delta-3,4-glucoseen reductase n=1 Tax=Castellaniella sp. S9 TaxID=2993652 RepID=UPI0022B3242D|nr:CDP-6-deoxy-delta-3,4-glucoseen reductase [Castellaniella sp. S9]